MIRSTFHEIKVEGESHPEMDSKLLRVSSRFTLIELLICIGIIGILASLLLPAIGRVKYSAKKIACVNNLKQVSLGLMQYQDDSGTLFSLISTHDGDTLNKTSFKRLSHGINLEPLIEPYGIIPVWGCVVTDTPPIDHPNNTRFICYTNYDYFPGSGAPNPFKTPPPLKMIKATSPSEQPLIQDGMMYVRNLAQYWASHSRVGNPTQPVPGINPSHKQFRNLFPSDASIAFYDGHVENFLFSELEDVGSTSEANSNNRQYSVQP